MEDVLLCQVGDSPAVDGDPFDENCVAHDAFKTNFCNLAGCKFWGRIISWGKSAALSDLVLPVSEIQIEELGSAKKNPKWWVGVVNEWKSARDRHDDKIPDVESMNF